MAGRVARSGDWLSLFRSLFKHRSSVTSMFWQLSCMPAVIKKKGKPSSQYFPAVWKDWHAIWNRELCNNNAGVLSLVFMGIQLELL